MEELAEVLGCEVGQWPFEVFRVSSCGYNPRAISFWYPAVERVERRLEGWSIKRGR